MAKLRREEREGMSLLGEAATKCAKLPVEHPADVEEFVLAIHAAQNIVLSRVGLRDYKRRQERDEEPYEQTDAVGFSAGLSFEEETDE